MLIYVGTYTGPKSKGIYALRMDGATGALSKPMLAAQTEKPTFLALSPDGKFLYAVNEMDEVAPGKGKVASLSAFAVQGDGMLAQLNSQPTGGAGPCYVAIDRAGRYALVANYGSGSVAVFPIESDGRLGKSSAFEQHQGKSVDPKRQEGPHAHCFDFDPAEKFVLSADLGLDKILVYRFDSQGGTLHAAGDASVAPGAGPRHLTFSRDGRLAYVISEMGNTITAFAYDAAHGALSEIQTVATLPADWKNVTGGQPSYAAEIAVHPSGQFLYGSNREHDSIAIFSVEQSSGKLSPRGHASCGGKWPRHFTLDPKARFVIVANQKSDNVVVLRIEDGGGRLQPTGISAEVGGAVCVQIMREEN